MSNFDKRRKDVRRLVDIVVAGVAVVLLVPVINGRRVNVVVITVVFLMPGIALRRMNAEND
jgi:lipopolysaccharide/colanic/teichoic acid biosynthesis glycosyltransferase